MASEGIDQALSEISVSEKWQHDPACVGWWPDNLPWGVSTPTGDVVALFASEKAALHYRLSLVNQCLNDGWHLPQSPSQPQAVAGRVGRKTLTMWTWGYDADLDASSLHNGWAIWSDADRDGAIDMVEEEGLGATLYKLTVTVETMEPISVADAEATKT